MLVTAVEEHSDEVHRVAAALEDAGFISRVNLSAAPNDGVDPNWHAAYNAGDMGRAAFIRVAGTDHLPLDPGKTVVETLKQAVEDVSIKYSYLPGLPVKFESNLRSRLGGC